MSEEVDATGRGEVGGRIKEEGVDGVVEVGVVERWCGESGQGDDVGKSGAEGGKGGDGRGGPCGWVVEMWAEEGVDEEGGEGVDEG